MPDTPTPAPALTDEQIDAQREHIRSTYGIHSSGGTSAGMYASFARFDAWYAAVIARAKREDRERIGAQTIYVVQEWVEADGIHDGWNTAYGGFTNSRADAEGTLEYLRKTHRDTEFRLVTATRSNWKEATDETR